MRRPAKSINTFGQDLYRKLWKYENKHGSSLFLAGLPSFKAAPAGRDSGNDFGRFSVPFFEGRISDICGACVYVTSFSNISYCINLIPFIFFTPFSRYP